ncbi:MAG: hypothetical protein UV78_C0020G0008 [Parcubacteria group bacterium GW2011_GWA2_43_17]|nr:MAG: hypothetical protein UV78_C0020G0008 [Parcubacteria group bacterium GW2011_GWA2_43_17]OHB43070.1 MAG: hypothetical protein A2Y13_00510 [Planctomycetes bacterium GWC2_45_44]
MKKRIFLMMTIVLFVTGIVLAGPNWMGTAHSEGGDRLWTTDLNWDTGAAPMTGSSPLVRTYYLANEDDYPEFTDGMTGDYVQLIVGYPDTPADTWPARLDITGGTMTLRDLWLSFAFAPNWQAVINMSNGSVSCTKEVRIGYYGAVGTLNMTGGSFSCAGDLFIGPDGGKGIINLSGGTFSTTRASMWLPGYIDITGTGKFSMPDSNGTPVGQTMSKIIGWASSGGITTPDRVAQLVTDSNLYCLKIEWNGVDTTTASAKQYGVNQASKPQPVQYRLGVSAPLTLGWTKGATALSHNVYIGTSFADVNTAANPNVLPGRGNQTSVTYTPTFELETATTYYWRIDEVDGSNTYKGEVWEFTTAPGDICNPVLAGDLDGNCIVNFEDFAIMSANWLDCTKTLFPCP